MVKKNNHLLYVIKDAGGRMARDEIISEYKIVLEVCQITMVIYIREE
jgi:hypothetical protein